MKKIIAIALALVMLLALVSCTKEPAAPADDSGAITDDVISDPVDVSEPEDENEPDETPDADAALEEELTPEEKQTIEEILSEVDFVEEENRYILTIGEIKSVYYLEGDKVVGYKSVIAFPSEEAMNDYLGALNATMQLDPDCAIRSVKHYGTVVELEYTESGFPYSNRADLKEAYDSYKMFAEMRGDN